MADVPNEPVVYLNRDFAPLGEAIEEVRAQPSLQGTPDDTPERGGHDPPRARVEYG